MKKLLIVGAAAIVGTLTGCLATHENIYAEHYRSNTIGATPDQLAAAFQPPNKNPQIVRIDWRSPNAYFKEIHLQGYRPIGVSEFTTALDQPDSDILELAKSVHADLVVTFSGYAGQQVVNLPYENTISSGGFSTTNMNATSAGSTSGQFSGDVNGTYSGQNQGQLTGTVTTYTPPVTSTQWMPTNVQYTKLSAVFMRRAIPGRTFRYSSSTTPQ